MSLTSDPWNVAQHSTPPLRQGCLLRLPLLLLLLLRSLLLLFFRLGLWYGFGD